MEGMLALFQPVVTDASSLIDSTFRVDIQLGRVLRIVEEDDEPYVILARWWPIVKKHKHGERLNLFGTWAPGGIPVMLSQTNSSKRQVRRKIEKGAEDCYVHVTLPQVLVWPIQVERGNTGTGAAAEGESGRIPFSAFHHLWAHHQLDFSADRYTFSDRGKAYAEEAKGCQRPD